MKSFEVSHLQYLKRMHLNSTYLFIKQIGADVQAKGKEESMNGASWQVDLEDQMPTFCLQKVHTQTEEEWKYLTGLN